jgi:hypothetical protein
LSDHSETNRDGWLLAVIASAISVVALIYYYRHDAILLYGDAVAHINVARRVFDSRRPGPSQLGTVWLPIPHILMLPFIVSRWAWQTGLGGSIPSMVGYVAGVLGIFRLLRRGFASIGATTGRARVAAWFGALVFAGNPNLIYLQATAMGESLYLAFFIWATVHLSEFVQRLRNQDWQGARKSLRWCGVMLFCAMLSRYDGWFAAAFVGGAALLALVFSRVHGQRGTLWRPEAKSGFVTFALLIALAPAFWLIWNQAYFGNALEWMNGPYSARAIMQRSMKKGDPPHPGYHDVKTAAAYYVKCAKLNLAGDNLEWGGARFGWARRIENAWPVLAVLGTLLVLLLARAMWPLLLLWVPLLFYGLAISYGGVPIFMPVWWPYSYYNVRYGMHMLPAAAVFVAIVLFFVLSLAPRRAFVIALTAVAVAFVATSYGTIWKSGPVCLHEPQANSPVRIELERRIGAQLNALPRSSTMLAQIGYYSGVYERAGIPLKRTINETDFRLWQAALADPAHHVDYLVAADDDRVSATAREHATEFEAIAHFEAPGQPSVTVYRKRQ